MNSKKKFVLPVVVLLFLSLALTASTGGTNVEAQSESSTQYVTVYIESMDMNDQNIVLSTDEIEWYEGEEANRIFAQIEPEAAAEIGGVPNDYYIVNDSENLISYPVADHASVSMQIYDHTGNIEDLDINWNEQITQQEFIDAFKKTDIIDLSDSPYHITIQGGQITSIVQQYTP